MYMLIDRYKELQTKELEELEITPETCLAYLRVDQPEEDEGECIRGKQFAIAHALYQFCCDWHGGQSSRLYQILSCMHLPPIRFEPSRGDWSLEDDDQIVYDKLEEWVRDADTREVNARAVVGDPLKPQLDEEEDEDGC